MAINRSGIPLFSGAEDAEDLFLATMEEYDSDVTDLVELANPLLMWLKECKKIERPTSIGLAKNVNLLAKENSTVQDHTHYDDIDRTPQDALVQAVFPYGSIVGTQVYSREEIIKNQNNIVDLVDTKATQLHSTMKNKFQERLLGAGASNGKIAAGIGRLMTPDVSFGNIDPATEGFEYWNPQVALANPEEGTRYNLLTQLRPGIRRATRQASVIGLTEPDVAFCGEDTYDALQAYAEDKLEIRLDELKDERGWGGHNMFPYNNKVYIYEPSINAKTMWLMNSTTGFRVRIHKGSDFQMTPWEKYDGKLAKYRNCIVYYTVYSKRRNANVLIEYQ